MAAGVRFLAAYAHIPALARQLCADPDGDGYTNLEDYLNYLAAGGSQNP